MFSIWWLLAAFLVGTYAGIFLIALMQVCGDVCRDGDAARIERIVGEQSARTPSPRVTGRTRRRRDSALHFRVSYTEIRRLPLQWRTALEHHCIVVTS